MTTDLDAPTSSDAPLDRTDRTITPAGTRRPARRPSAYGARAHLEREWARLRADPDVLATVRGWSVVDVSFDDLDQLLVHAGHLVPTTPDTERVLHRLVVLARHHELATRIVIQRLVPGLLALGRRWRDRSTGAGAFEELLGAAWVVIRTYDPARRPSCLAPALLRGAEHRAFRAELRPRTTSVVAMSPELFDRAEDDLPTRPGRSIGDTAFEELTMLLRDARDAGLATGDLDLLVRLASVDSPAQVAADLGVTPRTIRNRRDQVVARLRSSGIA